jgi:hypothetical protein
MALDVEADACAIELIETNFDQSAAAGRRGGDADWTRRKHRRQAQGWGAARAVVSDEFIGPLEIAVVGAVVGDFGGSR